MELSSSPEAGAAINNKLHSRPPMPATNYDHAIHESSSASKQQQLGGNGAGGNNNSNINISQGGANITRPDTQAEQPPQLSSQLTNSSLTVKKPANSVHYKECLKNHAANMGGYAVDGCGEFMPSGEDGSIEALKCAACGCHRNFHRREIKGTNNLSLLQLALPSNISSSDHGEDYGHHHHNSSSNNNNNMNNHMQGFHSYPSSAGVGFLPHHHHLHHHHQYMHSLINNSKVGYGGSSAKRFRTKFTMEQREKMFEFSEKLGWRIQKQDEAAVQQFCAEAGIKRHVLKVWMHNNKNTFGKKLLRFPEAFNPLPESS